MRMKLAFVLLFVAVAAAIAMKERLFEDPEEFDEKRGNAVSKDILSTFSCRYMKTHGFLASNPKLKKLCLTTFDCNDLFSNKSCNIAKARNECAKDSKLSLTYCPFTCNKCGQNTQCNNRTSVALGMQSKAIPDSKITASTNYNNHYLPPTARLHMNSYGWTPKVLNLRQWIQVDLSRVTRVTAIATQGSKNGERMTSYSLQHSLNGSTFMNYQGGKVFSGNTDKNTVVKHFLKPPIVDRYIRVLPKTWHGYPTMRMELYGCK